MFSKGKDNDKFTLDHFRREAARSLRSPHQGHASPRARCRSLNEVLVKHAIVTDDNKVRRAAAGASGWHGGWVRHCP